MTEKAFCTAHHHPPHPRPTVWLLFFISPAGFLQTSLCELFQIQSVPASRAIEFCFHYAGFPGSFKLVLILSSLLRPLKRGGVPTFLGKWGPIPVPRMAFSWQGLYVPCLSQGLSVPGQLPDFQAGDGSPPRPWESRPGSQQPDPRPPGSDGPLLSETHPQHNYLSFAFSLVKSRQYENNYPTELKFFFFFTVCFDLK